jgi:hypothetical protein
MTQSRFHAFDLSLAGARHRGFATLAGLVLPLALLAAGCGGGGGGGGSRLSKTQYEARVQKDAADVRDAFTPLSKAPSSLKELANEIKTGQNKLRGAANDLDGISPPKDVAHDNDVLVAGLRKLATLLEPLRKGAADGDPAAVQKAASDLQKSNALKEAQDATEDMKKKGYKIGTLGG